MVSPKLSNASVIHKPISAHSCVRCAERKVKCDRRQPCDACMRHNVECIFRELPPPRRRKKPTKEEILIARLKLYESILQEKGIESQELPTQVSKTSGSGEKRDPDAGFVANDMLQLLVYGEGRSKFLDNDLWTRVIEEFREPGDALGNSSDNDSEAEAEAVEKEDMDDSAGVVLSLSPVQNSGRKCPHPPTDHILELWRIFLERINPLFRVVHVPTLQRALQVAISNLKRIPRNLEAILFAIYSASVMSLDEHDCERRFGQSRKTLLSRYIQSTKVSLLRAKFMGTTDLVVLQAFLIYLLSVRHIYDSRTLWTLTGVAIRIGEGMGLHRDGTFLGLPPFETEIRRRTWWEMKMLDQRTAYVSGSSIFDDVDMQGRTPKRPANINDDELFPGMPSPPRESNKVTDMFFCAMRSEFKSFWINYAARKRQQGKSDDLWDNYESRDEMKEKDTAIDELEQVLESKYVRYCDPSQPIQLMAMLFARFSISSMRFMVHHPRRWKHVQKISSSERQYVWDLSVKLLEQYNMPRTSPQLKLFSWQVAFYFQWQAFIHVLDTL
ncbi:uncharacterized protein Z518_03289 [Rhinocladiella mackenziei CBS 650.93]|uniref:Zn(2)-C6 fungal-type domain-containing protein n=1 Tax=Rhinocladiella mackenziei CBS 650.93 TaxID=1442369 RepID=A0A0D2G288_9EURO|nr:uncharacterized protein Z518_03289 [Rhinocladiella mackenziei CBS 650.93]KIX08632.1 hypothetical protein Z518_03289 [Rhinocladiella mackenziei CBS 650.93]